MSSTMQDATQETTLKYLFETNKITKVAIIDDAFDDPSKDNITLDNLKTFLGAAGKEKLAQESGVKHRIWKFEEDFAEIDASDIYDNKIIDKLWKICEEDKCELSKIAQHYLFNDKLQKTAKIVPLMSFLKKHGIDVSLLPSSSGPDDLSGIRVVFIDYYLSIGPTDEEAAEIAKTLAGEIYKKDNDRLFLLISTNSIDESQINGFIEKAKLVGGVFYFIKKDDFQDELKLNIKLSNVIKALPHSSLIQQFTESIAASLEETTIDFLNAIRRLSLEDYSHLYRLSLKADGHPLGDYMLWLLESYFGHLLFEKHEKVIDAQRKLDATDFQDDLIRQLVPSNNVADFHNNAMFLNINDIVDIPDKANTIPQEAMLNLGDIFIKDKEILMVINAQCDLANQRRKYNANYSILLIPGRLSPLENKLSKQEKTKPITQIFLHEDNKYRIVWNTKELCSCKHRELFKWITQDVSYTRKYRLRVPYSIEVQQTFTSDISRVGIPVMPPVNIPVLAKVYYKKDSDTEVCLEIDDGVYITSKKINPGDDKDSDPKYLCFTGSFIDLLIDKIRELILIITEAIKESSNGRPKEKLERYKEKLENLLNEKEIKKLTIPTKFKNGSIFNETSIMIFENIEPSSFESICIHISTSDTNVE